MNACSSATLPRPTLLDSWLFLLFFRQECTIRSRRCNNAIRLYRKYSAKFKGKKFISRRRWKKTKIWQAVKPLREQKQSDNKKKMYRPRTLGFWCMLTPDSLCCRRGTNSTRVWNRFWNIRLYGVMRNELEGNSTVITSHFPKAGPKDSYPPYAFRASLQKSFLVPKMLISPENWPTMTFLHSKFLRACSCLHFSWDSLTSLVHMSCRKLNLMLRLETRGIRNCGRNMFRGKFTKTVNRIIRFRLVSRLFF